MFKNKKVALIVCCLLFLLLCFLCVCSKSGDIYNAVNSQSSSIEISKKDSKVLVSGVFGSSELAHKTISKLKMFNDDVKKGDIQINKEIDPQSDKWSEVVDNISYYFSNGLENAKLKFLNNELVLEGSSLSKDAKNDILLAVGKLKSKGIEIKNSLKLIEPANDKQKIKKELYELLHSKTIQFQTGQVDIKENSYKLLDNIVEKLKAYPEIKVIIEGHTDDMGEADFNQKLSEDRAEAIKNYFASKSIDEDRLSTIGFGEYRPAFPNNSIQNRQKNRRVEFKVKGE